MISVHRAVRLAVCLSLASAVAGPLAASCTMPTFVQQPGVLAGHPLADFALGDAGTPDGDLDLFTADLSHGTHGVESRAYNSGSATFDPPWPAVAIRPSDIALADMNGDGRLDVISAQTGARPACVTQGSCASIRVGLDDGVTTLYSEGATCAISSVDEVKRILPADFNKDGKMDLLIGSSTIASAQPGVHILWGSGGGSFDRVTDHHLNGPVGDIAAGDFDNDGDTDFAVAVGKTPATAASHIDTFRNDHGSFAATPAATRNLLSASAGLRLAAGHFNGDAILDLAVAMETTTELDPAWNAGGTSILTGTGTGAFSFPATGSVSDSRFIDIALADVDEDGKLDIVLIGGRAAFSVVRGNGNGRFVGSPPWDGTLEGNPSRVLSLDHDHDGRTDLFFMDPVQNRIIPLLNRCARHSAVEVSSSPNPSTWGSAATFTASIIRKPGSPVPTGTVVFFEKGTELGSATLNGAGNAILTRSDLSIGTHSIVAVYTGDEEFSAAVSEARSHTVQRLPFGAPLAVTATGISGANAITISWIATANTLEHDVLRRENGQWIPIGTTTGESFVDLKVVGTNAYIYAVRSRGGATGTQVSPNSAPDVATTAAMGYPADHKIRASDILTTRQLIASFRAAAGASPFLFTDAALAGEVIRAVHLTELRAAIATPRNAIGLPPLTFTYPAPTAGVTTVKLVDIWEIRNSFQ